MRRLSVEEAPCRDFGGFAAEWSVGGLRDRLYLESDDEADQGNGEGRGDPGAKETVTLRIDQDVLDFFQEDGRGWQDRINAALRKAAGQSND